MRAAAAPAGAGGGACALVPAAALALCVIAVWVAWGPVRETLAVAGSEATSASYYAPVERFLARAGARAPVRVEVPLTRSHWEAALLAPAVSLARGWEKQLEDALRRRAARARASRRERMSAGCTNRRSPTSRCPTRRSTPRAPRRAA